VAQMQNSRGGGGGEPDPADDVRRCAAKRFILIFIFCR